MSSSSGKALAYLICGFAAGLWMIYDSVQKYRLLQKINNTPTSKAEAAAVGLIELAGQMYLDKPILSPISGTSCCFWRIKAQYYRSGKGGGWKDLYSEDSTSIPFYLKDETGKILVDPRGGDITIPADAVYEGYISGKGVFGVSHTQMPQPVLSYIDSRPEAVKKKFMGVADLDVRIFEHYIIEGDPLYVLGTAMSRDDVSSAVGCESLVVKKGNYDKLLLIRDTEERKIVAELSGSIKWTLPIGLALSAVCLLILLFFIGVT